MDHNPKNSSVSRDSLNKLLTNPNLTPLQRELILLRLEYSNISKIRTDYLASLEAKERIYPTILPTQSSGRWSYLNPALSNFPKKCINPECLKGEHEKTQDCFSLIDCVIPEENSFWICHDLDAVEHRIYSLILNWKERLQDLHEGKDIHTPVTCDLFSLPYPRDFLNPHYSEIDTEWRSTLKWQGKDDPRRTLSKNFTYGGQYFYVSIVTKDTKVRLPYRVYKSLKYSPGFVHTIPNIQSYKVLNEDNELVTPDFESLAIKFVESNVEIQKRKAVLMEKYRKDKVSRTIYGGKRTVAFSDIESAKALFNHTIQGTVASYINESCILLQRAFPESYLIHNQHDSLKWAHYYESTTEEGKELERKEVLQKHKEICQRDLEYQGSKIKITATFKVVF